MRARAARATELGPDFLIQRLGRDGIGRYHVYFRGCLRHAAVPQFRQYSRHTTCSSRTRAGSRQNGGAYVGAIGPADGTTLASGTAPRRRAQLARPPDGWGNKSMAR